MTKSCGQCKWFGTGVPAPSTRRFCTYPIPIWLQTYIISGPLDRLADYVDESWGSDCRTFERKEGPETLSL